MNQSLFAEVLLPVPLKGTFTYDVPAQWHSSIAEGMRVLVPFGQKRLLTGIVTALHGHAPTKYTTKSILELIDLQPVVLPIQLEFWKWIAEYYLCSLGEVLQAALPSGLKLSSESRIQVNPFAQEAAYKVNLSEKEQVLLQALKQKRSLSYQEAVKAIGSPSAYKVIKSLLHKQLILISEEVQEKYQPKKVKKVRLNADYVSQDGQKIIALLETLKKKPKQEQILLKYLSFIPPNANSQQHAEGIFKSQLITPELSLLAYKNLLKGGILEEFEVIISRLETAETNFNAELPCLTSSQQEALQKILAQWQEKQTVLLHGVTGSGKTEIYIHLIEQILQSGAQALLLLPEIALTTQIVMRLQKVFGDRLGVYHSRFSDHERVETWLGVLYGKLDVVVGVRSAIFLPFSHLGVIIVDEEHDASYKQEEPAPRYHARDAALILAQRHGAKVLLGTATPSMESFYHAAIKRYGYVSLRQRYQQVPLPSVEFVNIRHESRAKRMLGELAPKTIQAIKEALQARQQVILFQNRRGYAPRLVCQRCNWVPRCQHCDVSLTFHLYDYQLRCHYCGYEENPPLACTQCHSKDLAKVGYGTEKIEDTVKSLFPEAVVQRLDLDTTRRKHALRQIIEDFSARKIDILVGTQMVTKGLDFDHVSLVVVFDIDRALHYPDFRAHERVFQALTQVAGRAGRRNVPGRVIIQTADPHHPVLEYVATHRFEDFYKNELPHRQQFRYPPFTRLVEISLKGEKEDYVETMAIQLADQLRVRLGSEKILGPQAPLVEKVRDLHIRNILIKLERESALLKAAKEQLLAATEQIAQGKTFGKGRVIINVDPV